MLMTQLQAINKIKAETGRSIVACTQLVRAMDKETDGCRDKVFLADVEAAIKKANTKPALPAPTFRPIKPEQRARVAVV